MKTLRVFPLLGLLMAVTTISFAQKTKTESFAVSGNCGMCKAKIEKAAKEAGASSASWDVDAKTLTVTYKNASTNTAKIQQKIASVGYDNVGFKASDEAYNKLHGCCKYDRVAGAGEHKASCCSDKCEMKDGKCTDMAACKDKGCCDENGVCKTATCSKEGHEGKDCCKKSQ